ncbi:MAG: serine/threonine protein kinase [Deltaproteobacteria bacterium]|nr:serine/threonine protein kinase [Deltaproteobacteria bacterium]
MHQDANLVALRDHLLGSYLVGTADVRFYLREVIGEGGQGWVYKANYDEPDGMWVVVKILRPDSVNEETFERFRREAEVLRMLGAQATPTPNVVRFYDHGLAVVGVPGGGEPVQMPFTVLEYVDGVTLAKVLEGPPRRALPVERVRRVLRQVVRALETVHAHRVVHRDLKPSNILLTMQGTTEVAKVTDFGLVKLVDFKLTQTATVAGASLGYAPPEQYEQGNERVSARTDVFSLSAIIYEALAGCEAFPYKEGENPLRLISRLLTAPRPTLAARGSAIAPELVGQPDLIAALDREICRGTQSDPGQRHGTCRELWDAVEPVLREAAQRGGAVAGDLRPASAEVPVKIDAYADAHRHTDVNRWSVLGQGSIRNVIDMSKPVSRVLCEPVPDMQVRKALIGADGSMIAIGPQGFHRWDGARWSELPVPAGIEPRAVRGLTRTHDQQLLVYGDRGLASVVGPTGVAEPLTSPLTDLCFHCAWCDPDGSVALVGERLSRPAGVVVLVGRGEAPRVRFLDWTPRLRSVVRLTNGTMVASGDAGALVQIDASGNTPIPWERTAHLYDLSARPDGGASVVGTGGHALSMTERLTVHLEAVQTTRDLLAVDIGADGAMWTAAAAGRILRRSRGVWERIPTDPSVTSRFAVIGPTDVGVLAMAEDGLVIEVRQGF